jgi:LAO/AO transport system kinase
MSDMHRSRRALGRLLTRLSSASVAESLALVSSSPARAARIGFTGAPGAGKSTLISRFAKRRLPACRDTGGLAVLAVDPSSPLTKGAILGDRIRMDAVANEPELYIRSVASRSSTDGLADNVADLVAALDQYGFREIVLETVGVGQAEHAIRHLVDTVVVVLQPDCGDAIQAMKAGILEVADIYVVNKADLPGARKTAAEIRAILDRPRDDGWTWPLRPVIEVSHARDDGVVALDAAVTEHLAWVAAHRDAGQVGFWRRRYHLQSLIVRRVSELLDGQSDSTCARNLQEAYDALVNALASPAGGSERHRRP